MDGCVQIPLHGVECICLKLLRRGLTDWWAFSSAFSDILKTWTTDVHTLQPYLHQQQQNTSTVITALELFQVPHVNMLSGKALQVREAACEITGSNDQTSAEESPRWCCGYKVSFSSLHVVLWLQVRPWRGASIFQGLVMDVWGERGNAQGAKLNLGMSVTVTYVHADCQALLWACTRRQGSVPSLCKAAQHSS